MKEGTWEVEGGKPGGGGERERSREGDGEGGYLQN